MRYAVLLDLRDPDLLPIGLVTEHDDAVRVHYAVDCGLKNTYRDPYSVREPDGTLLRYEPGDPEYFGSVLNTLSRGFALNELSQAPTLDLPTVGQLLREKVLLPRAQRPVRYTPGGAKQASNGARESLPTVKPGGSGRNAAWSYRLRLAWERRKLAASETWLRLWGIDGEPVLVEEALEHIEQLKHTGADA